MSPQNTRAEAQHRKDIEETTVVLYDLLRLKHTDIAAQETLRVKTTLPDQGHGSTIRHFYET